MILVRIHLCNPSGNPELVLIVDRYVTSKVDKSRFLTLQVPWMKTMFIVDRCNLLALYTKVSVNVKGLGMLNFKVFF